MDIPIIVIGASTGGVAALKRLVAQLPPNLAAALFVVLHIPARHRSLLHEILSDSGPLPALQPANGEPIEAGRIYVAVPNHHLLVKEGHTAVIFGPRENRARPSIDALFRSAAASHTTHVTAVLLTGYLSDGISGLAAVRRCGGRTIVQDPAESEAPELPRAAIERVPVDHILDIEGIAAKIVEIADLPLPAPGPVAEEIMEEVKVSEHSMPELEHMHTIGELTPYTCPECGGTLWKSRKEPLTRYMCHTGHAFSEEAFLDAQAEAIEDSLWSTIRFVQERIDVLHKMVRNEKARGRTKFAAELEHKMNAMRHHVSVLRQFIVSGVLKNLQNNGKEEGKAKNP